MNKSLYILIAAIVVVGGLIAYTVLPRSSESAHTAGDGHTEAQYTESAPHDDTGKAPHATSSAPAHNDSGQAPHND